MEHVLTTKNLIIYYIYYFYLTQLLKEVTQTPYFTVSLVITRVLSQKKKVITRVVEDRSNVSNIYTRLTFCWSSYLHDLVQCSRTTMRRGSCRTCLQSTSSVTIAIGRLVKFLTSSYRTISHLLLKYILSFPWAWQYNKWLLDLFS
jgi:hypothetical protein